MATFSTNEIDQIWEIFNLEREELHTGSALLTCLSQTESDDVTYGTTIVEKVQRLLIELTQLETEIEAVADGAGIEVIDIEDFYRVEQKDSGSPLSRPLAIKAQKKERIATLLKLDQYISTGSAQYARVNSIGGGSGRYYHN